MGHVLLVAEQDGGKLRNATLNGLTFAREVAAKEGAGSEVYVLVMGKGVDAAVEALRAHAVAKVLVADDAALEHYLGVPYAQVAAAAAKRAGASVVCAAATAVGKDLLPRVAARLGAPMASDVVGVLASGRQYRRPMYAGNVLADVDLDGAVVCVTSRTVAFAAAAPADGGAAGAAPVEKVPVELDAVAKRVRYVGFAATGGDRPELTEARIVVSGGRGMKSRENFTQYVEPLADAFGAAVGASRAAVDSGYAPNDWQVGQTGKVVAPELYIAIAISGAIQHLAGMSGSKVIVAVNKDPEAPIFQVADYGLVADAFKAVPELTEKVKAYRASQH